MVIMINGEVSEMKQRRKYNREFKIEAVRQLREVDQSIAEVARDLGINAGVLGRWRRQYEDDPTEAFPGHGKLKPEEDDVVRLRREVVTLRQERDFLKKAAAFFAKDMQ